MNVVACPSCSQQLQYNPQQAGQPVQCPHCQSAMILPGAHNPIPPANPTPPVNPMMNAPMQTPPLQPGLYGQQNVSSPAQNRKAKKKTWTQKLAEMFSDRKAQQKLLRSKGFVAGASSLGGLVIIIAIINFSLGLAKHISRHLSSDIPIPSFLAAVGEPEGEAMIPILFIDEKDRFGVFRVTDKDKIEGDVMRWFNKELAKRDWKFVSQGGAHSRVWRQGNRRLFVGAKYADKQIGVTIIESPDYPWKD